MSFLDDLGETIANGSKAVADKAKEFSEIANLRAQIVSCDNAIHKNYKELGKLYFEDHKDDPEFAYSNAMNIIKDSMSKKEALLAQIADMKDKSDATDTVEPVTEPEQDEEVATVIEEINDSAIM